MSGSVTDFGNREEIDRPSLSEEETDRPSLSDIVRYDFPASIVVFLVAVPLSLGIAVASGAPIVSGLISAAVGGILCGALGGSQRLVSGPAAGMVVIVAGLVDQFDWRTMCAITLLAGLLQVAFGLSGVARWALGITPAVVHGMLAGIGVTIILGQFHVLLGFKAASSPLDNIQSLPADIAAEHPWETLIGSLALVVMLLWPRVPKQVRVVPGALVAVVLTTGVATAFQLPVTRVSVPGDILSAIQFAPVLPEGDMAAFAMGVIAVALVASVENLLSAVAVDKMHTGPRTNLSRELVGQGVANAACGAVGGLPVTGVIVRSSTNVQAGARTRWSAVLHGVWILIFTLFLSGLVNLVPMAALAGLLIHVGIKLVNLAHIRNAARFGDLFVYAATLAGVVGLDLMKGVGIGLALAILLTLRRALWTDVRVHEDAAGHHVVAEGALTFLSVPRLNHVLHQIPHGRTVTVDLIANYLDQAAFETLEDWREAYERMGGEVVVNEIGHDWVSRSRDGAPTRHRKEAAVSTPPLVGSWSEWQASAVLRDTLAEAPEAETVNPSLARGIATYRRHTSRMLRPTWERLSAAQEPRTLMITCADSRIVPNLITTSGPGDLFVVRNVGNLVPTWDLVAQGKADASVAAAMEYAVTVLNIDDIVVCGHSRCGAMGALAEGGPDGLSAVGQWLVHGDPSIRRRAVQPQPVLQPPAAGGELGEADVLALHNVVQQLEHVKSHPFVATRLAEGHLKVAGMFFDVSSGSLHLVSESLPAERGEEAARRGGGRESLVASRALAAEE